MSFVFGDVKWIGAKVCRVLLMNVLIGVALTAVAGASSMVGVIAVTTVAVYISRD